MDQRYTIQELADHLKVSAKTILREIKRGKLKAQKAGRRLLVLQADLDKYLYQDFKTESSLSGRIETFFRSKADEMTVLLQRFVSTPSISNERGAEGRLAILIKRKLDQWGIRNVVYKSGGVYAVHASFGYAKTGILLDSPLDTLPPGDISKWTYPPFDGVVANGKMFGRGTADAKAGIVSMLYTLLFLAGKVDENKIRVEAVFDGGEQDGAFSGMKEALKRGVSVSSGIIGYAGDMQDILVGARGYHRYLFTTHGKAVHTGSRFKPGVNAISKMTKVVTAIEELKFPKAKNNLFQFGSRLTFATIAGGSAINMVPDECLAKVDIRVTPEIDKIKLDGLISKTISDLKKSDNELEVDCSYILGQEAYLSSEKDLLVESIKKATKEHLGRELALTASGPAHVGNLLAEYGIPTVVFGPKGENVHSYDEYVEIDSLPLASKVYVKTILNYYGLS